jgi:hypothetical protein
VTTVYSELLRILLRSSTRELPFGKEVKKQNTMQIRLDAQCPISPFFGTLLWTSNLEKKEALHVTSITFEPGDTVLTKLIDVLEFLHQGRVTPLSAMVKSKLKQKQISFTVYPNQAMHHRRHHLRLSSSLLSCARTPPLLFKQPNIKLRTNIASSNKTKQACKTVYLSKRSSSIYPNLS